MNIVKTLLLCVALLPLKLVQAAEPPLDHYQPAALHALALKRQSEGDVSTARVLMERAALIAPYDVRIRGTLAQLRANQDRLPLSVDALPEVDTNETKSVAATPSSKAAALPEFALWPQQ